MPRVASRSKKATFSLREELLEAVSLAVAQGAAASKNALVESALVKELENWRRQARRAQWEEAAHDPLFLRDVQEIENAFRSADAETARGIG